MKLKRFSRYVFLFTLTCVIIEFKSLPDIISNPIKSAEIILITPGIPLAIPPPIPISAPRTSLMFTGDINPGRCIARASLTARDFTYPFQFVAEKLRSADITIGSLDGTISNQS
jgi:hypothetical protein